MGCRGALDAGEEFGRHVGFVQLGERVSGLAAELHRQAGPSEDGFPKQDELGVRRLAVHEQELLVREPAKLVFDDDGAFVEEHDGLLDLRGGGRVIGAPHLGGGCDGKPRDYECEEGEG